MSSVRLDWSIRSEKVTLMALPIATVVSPSIGDVDTTVGRVVSAGSTGLSPQPLQPMIVATRTSADMILRVVFVFLAILIGCFSSQFPDQRPGRAPGQFLNYMNTKSLYYRSAVWFRQAANPRQIEQSPGRNKLVTARLRLQGCTNTVRLAPTTTA